MSQRTEGYFRGYNDFELFFQSWKTDQSRGTLVVTHGLGEHSECYNRLAEGIVDTAKWDIYAWDLRGHGRSEGKRGTIRAFSDYCEDYKKFVELVKKQTQKPIVLLGHSMGGLVTSASVIKYGEMGAKALVLSSPLFGISVQVPAIKEKAARFASKLLPNLTLHNELKYEDLTHDPSVIEEYEKDILRHDRISTSLFIEMVETMDYCLKSAGRVKLPFLLQYAGQDRIVSSPKAEEFYNRVGSDNKTLKLYEDFYHEIYNEIGRPIVFADLAAWLKQWES